MCERSSRDRLRFAVARELLLLRNKHSAMPRTCVSSSLLS